MAVALLVICYLVLTYSADFIRHASVYIEHLPFQGNELFKCSAGKQIYLCFKGTGKCYWQCPHLHLGGDLIATSDTSHSQDPAGNTVFQLYLSVNFSGN